jgi:hypothetical protein
MKGIFPASGGPPAEARPRTEKKRQSFLKITLTNPGILAIM